MKACCIVTSGLLLFLIAGIAYAKMGKQLPEKADVELAEIPTVEFPFTVVPSVAFDQIFQNLYHDPLPVNELEKPVNWNQFKEKLRSLVALHFNQRTAIYFNRIKSGPLQSQMEDIIDINPQLQPKMHGEDVSVKGYGIEFTVKLD